MARRNVDTAQFLCRSCRAVMCADCQSTAEEYERMYTLQRQARIRADELIAKAEQAKAEAERRAAHWEQIARAGMPPILQALYDTLGAPELCRRIEAAQAKYTEGGD